MEKPAVAAPRAVDFAFAPPEWQTSICLPDDPQKTLVDRSGELLYRYRGGAREFGLRIGVSVAEDARWVRQELRSPRVPIVRTVREAPGLQIEEEAFAVTRLPSATGAVSRLERIDNGPVLRGWAKPADGLAPVLRDVDVHYGGSLDYRLAVGTGAAARVALALCEGWWGEPGQRVQSLTVEGAAPRTADAAAELGKNKPGAFWFDGRDTNGDGAVAIRVDPAAGAKDRNTILNGLWAFAPGTAADDAALLAGKLDDAALVRADHRGGGGPPRNDAILVRVTNTAPTPREVRPAIVVETDLPLEHRRAEGRITVDGVEDILCSARMEGLEAAGQGRQRIRLEPMTLAPGEARSFCVVHAGGSARVATPRTVAEAEAAREAAAAYWERAPLPWKRVRVPDAGIQALLDASVRNIWQAREIKNGLPAFQVGPTCYRGLWVVDGAFLLEAATMLGAGDQARNGVAYTLTFQKDDGRFEIIDGYHKENGIVLWTCLRHAQLTRDRAWLESVWPRLERIMAHIQALRRQSLKNDSPLDDGLMPPGFPDGGLGPSHCYEYSNSYWNLAGVRAAIEAARWLGRDAQAAEWERVYAEFLAAFRKAAARDLRRDGAGNPYLPTYMGTNGATIPPAAAQWAFCHAVYPGGVFAPDDPLAAGNLAMLRATEREGMVYGTGWDKAGIWNYFASFYAHAWLWRGDGAKAADLLYAFANHAAPILAWREEQSLKGEPYRKVGDMPHNWASAEFIRLAVHLLALDRGRELHLFEGLPPEWAGPGLTTALDGIATPFGPLTLSLRVAEDGRSATLKVDALADAACTNIVVHLGGWASPDRGATLALDPRRAQARTIWNRGR